MALADRQAPPSTARSVLALTALAISAFAFVTSELLPGGLLTFMADDLNRSTAEIGLLVTGYAVVVVVASVPLARATARWPRRQVLTGTVLLAAAAGAWSALATSYPEILAARLVTGAAQALFWSVVVPAAASLFRTEIRGRMVSRLTMGGSVAPLLGVPAGTWLAETSSWRAAFWMLASLSLVAGLAVAALMPGTSAGSAEVSRGSAPDRRRFVLLVTAVPLISMAAMGLFTYQTQLLMDVAGLPASALSAVLLAGGIAGFGATYLVGHFVDRRPWAVLTTGAVLLVLPLLAWPAFGTSPVVGVAAVVLSGFAFSMVPGTHAHLVMVVAPGETGTANALASALFNTGTAAGAAVGALVVSAWDVRTLPMVLLGVLVGALVLLRRAVR